MGNALGVGKVNANSIHLHAIDVRGRAFDICHMGGGLGAPLIEQRVGRRAPRDAKCEDEYDGEREPHERENAPEQKHKETPGAHGAQGHGAWRTRWLGIVGAGHVVGHAGTISEMQGPHERDAAAGVDSDAGTDVTPAAVRASRSDASVRTPHNDSTFKKPRALRFSQLAHNLGRRAYDQHALGDSHFGWYQRARADQDIVADDSAIEHDRAHADKHAIADRAPMNERAVADGHVIADRGADREAKGIDGIETLAAGDMNDGVVLHIAAFADRDRK